MEGVTDPAEAVRAVRARAGEPRERTARAPAVELAGLSKADAVRRAFTELDDQAPRVVAAWLAARGVDVAPPYVSRRDSKTALTAPDDEPLRLAAS